MMKVPPLSLVGMERLPLPLPFSPELLWRYNPLGPPHSGPPASPSAAAAAAVAISRVNAVASLPNPLASQLPFAYDIKHTIPISLASDPRLWNRDDVITFLQWCEREFDLPSFDTDRFQMNGKALCLLTKSDLESRAPCSGDVIHNALQLLMSSSSESPLTPHTPSSMRLGPLSKGGWSIADLHYAASHQNGTTSVTLSPAPSLDGQAGSPQEHAGTNGNNHLSSSSSTGSAGNHSDDSEYDSVGESPQRSPVNQSLSPPPHSQSQQQHNSHQSNSSSSTTSSNGHNSSSNNNNNNNNHSSSQQIATSKSFSHGAKLSNGSGAEAGEYNNNGRLLWDFLQQLLNDPAQRYSSFIAWKNVETGIFKIVDPPGLARLWGIQKNHLSMNYDKMSRALRYYYRVNILRKVQGERHCYQFLRNPGELKSIKNISMLRHQQTSPVSLTVKSESSNFVDNEYDGLALIRHQQNSPVSLTVKSESSNFVDNDYDALSLVRHQQNSPVSLTVKSEPSYGDNAQDEYDDVPTDLSMDSERHLKDDD